MQLLFSPITSNTFGINNKFGSISNIYDFVVWIINLLAYIGWALVIAGVGYTIFVLVFTLINGESEEAFKRLSQAFQKVLVIIILGIILVSSGFILKTVSGLTNSVNAKWEVPAVFKL